jgi:TRAP-type C4-dicarboxylate transport system substrate-binding protein
MLKNMVRAAALAALAITIGAGSSRQAQAVEVLKANPGEGAGPVLIQAYRFFGPHLGRASGGNLRIDPVVGAAIASPRDVLSHLQARRVDIAPIEMALFPDAFPFSLLLRDLALLSAEPLTLAGAGTEFILFHCPPCLNEFRKSGALPLAITGLPPDYLATRNRAAALDEMAGKRIAATDHYARWVTRMGGTVAALPPSPPGAVDGQIGSLAELASSRLWTSLPNILAAPVGTAGSIAPFAVSMATWNDLGLGARAALIASSPYVNAVTVRAAMAAEAAARAQIPERSATFHAPNAAMAARAQTIRNETLAAVAAEAERRGLFAARELVERYALLLRRWSVLVARLGTNAEGFEDILYQEIYSKIDAREFGS